MFVFITKKGPRWLQKAETAVIVVAPDVDPCVPKAGWSAALLVISVFIV